MAKLKGKKKAAFLARINKGRIKKGLKAIKSKTSRKSSKKSGPKRTKSAPQRRKSQPIKRRRNKTKTRMAKKRGSSKRSKFGIPSIVKKAAAGVGLATIAAVVVSQVAPQAAPIVRPIAAFAGGGVVGVFADILLSGGGLLGNLFGGGGSGQMVESV